MYKKIDLFRYDFGRYAVRSLLAGAYLTVGPIFATVAGNIVDSIAPGTGPLVFALLFGLGFFTILVLGAELATGNMMFFCYGAVQGRCGWLRSLGVLVVNTLLNLVGVVIVAGLLGLSSALSDAGPNHLLFEVVDGKLSKDGPELFVDAIIANFVVNMAFVASLYAKDIVNKFFAVVPTIAIFVGLGLENVIADFSLISTALFSGAELPGSVTPGNVAVAWGLVFLGNLLGGGLLIGGSYGWLNLGRESYRD